MCRIQENFYLETHHLRTNYHIQKKVPSVCFSFDLVVCFCCFFFFFFFFYRESTLSKRYFVLSPDLLATTNGGDRHLQRTVKSLETTMNVNLPHQNPKLSSSYMYYRWITVSWLKKWRTIDRIGRVGKITKPPPGLHFLLQVHGTVSNAFSLAQLIITSNKVFFHIRK